MGSKVVIAMSGGVDSSVAAALLQDQGFEVIGMMMRLWSEPGRAAHNRCCTPEAMGVARRVAGKLGIPFYAISAQEPFRGIVVNYFLDGYKAGTTPNPCLACNRHIRWEFLLDRALAMGGEFMATGHYARVDRKDGEEVRLLEARDKQKDQSYVLSVLGQPQLRHAIFPLGDFTKEEVRDIAAQRGLPAAQAKESQDLCFLAGDDYRAFLNRHAPELSVPGPIKNGSGEVLGQHQGLVNYTMGQRKGLGISSAQPLFVKGKDLAENVLFVGPREELGERRLIIEQLNWISDESPPAEFEAEVKIRYKASKAAASVTRIDDSRIMAHFKEAQFGATPGQAAVFYQGEEVLGSGMISELQGVQTPIPVQEQAKA